MKIRIRKPLEGGKHLKKGVITVEDERGTYYRIDCEGCGLTLKLQHHPIEGDSNFCKECKRISDLGKPETRLVRHRKTFDYETPCDDCNTLERTSFLPKRNRPFLCNNCMRAQRNAAAQRETDPASRHNEQAPREGMIQDPAPKAHAPSEPPKHIPEETDRVPEPLSTEKRTYPSAAKASASFEAKCSKCRKKVHLKFQPTTKRPFVCPTCYDTRQQEIRGERPDTKVLYNIECTQCGKQETLNFIPTFPDRALCSSCFETMKRRKK